MNKNLRKPIALLLAVAFAIMQMTAVASADDSIIPIPELHGRGANGENNIPQGEGGHYMSNAHRDNYNLDIEELGMFDVVPAAASFLANMIFGLDRKIVEITTVVFYYCASFQVPSLFQGFLDQTQNAIKLSMFDVLMPIAAIAVLVFMGMALIKRNGQVIIGQSISFMAVLLIASVVGSQSLAIVTAIDNITMAVNGVVINAIYGSNGSGGYAVEVAASMWDSLVHRPWITLNLEGDTTPAGQQLADDLLSISPGSQQREDIIKQQVAVPGSTMFSKKKPEFQLIELLIYTLPLLAKCVVYLCIGVLQMAFRMMTVVMMLFGLFIMLFALFPQLGGTALVGSWVKKLLDLQINILVLSLLLTIVMRIDKELYNLMSQWGWMVVVLLQSAIVVALFLLRDKLFSLSKAVSRTTSRAISNPQQVLQGGLDSIEGAAGDAAVRLDRVTHDFVRGRKIDFKVGMRQGYINRRNQRSQNPVQQRYVAGEAQEPAKAAAKPAHPNAEPARATTARSDNMATRVKTAEEKGSQDKADFAVTSPRRRRVANTEIQTEELQPVVVGRSAGVKSEPRPDGTERLEQEQWEDEGYIAEQSDTLQQEPRPAEQPEAWSHPPQPAEQPQAAPEWSKDTPPTLRPVVINRAASHTQGVADELEKSTQISEKTQPVIMPAVQGGGHHSTEQTVRQVDSESVKPSRTPINASQRVAEAVSVSTPNMDAKHVTAHDSHEPAQQPRQPITAAAPAEPKASTSATPKAPVSQTASKVQALQSQPTAPATPKSAKATSSPEAVKLSKAGRGGKRNSA